MSFNWKGATAGLLGEVGNQAINKSNKMYALEEKKLAEDIANRKEAAALAKERSMKLLGFNEAGKPVSQGEYDSAAEKPLLYQKGLSRDKGNPETKKGALNDKQKYDIRKEMSAKYAEEMSMFDDGSKESTFGFGGNEATNTQPTEDEWRRANMSPEIYNQVYGDTPSISKPKTEQSDTGPNEEAASYISSALNIEDDSASKPAGGNGKPAGNGILNIDAPNDKGGAKIEPGYLELAGDQKESEPQQPKEKQKSTHSFGALEDVWAGLKKVWSGIVNMSPEEKEKFKGLEHSKKRRYIRNNLPPKDKAKLLSMPVEKQNEYLDAILNKG